MARRRAGDDPLVRGLLSLRQHGVGVELVAGEGVFSAAAVDPGTTYLLRWLARTDRRRVLDVGCGYGPLALWLAAAEPERHVVAIDRDALAVECTLAGAELNDLTGRVRVQGSVGYDDLDAAERFDLVVSNVPAKVGPAALRHLLLDARQCLVDDGEVAIVVIDRLAEPVGELLAGEPAIVVDEHHANRSYSTWRYHFVATPAGCDARPGFERGVYRRGTAMFRAGGLSWEATTSYTLAEFDTLAYDTEAAIELLRRQGRALPADDETVAVVGVGQGHLALAVRAATRASMPLRLVDRDLLALRTAAANLGPGVDLRHVARPGDGVGGCSAAVVALPEKQPVATTAALLEDAIAGLPPAAPVVLHGRAADLGRVVELLRAAGTPLQMRDRAAHRGGVAAFTVTPPA